MIAWRWWIRLFCRHAEGLTSRGRALLMSEHPAQGSFSARFSFSRIPKCSRQSRRDFFLFVFSSKGESPICKVPFAEQKNCLVYIKRALFLEWLKQCSNNYKKSAAPPCRHNKSQPPTGSWVRALSLIKHSAGDFWRLQTTRLPTLSPVIKFAN
jgi:hypothetical protein